ncbi:uncharacterized protein METZ01_LOCUS485174, partial [marine metagenome]
AQSSATGGTAGHIEGEDPRQQRRPGDPRGAGRRSERSPRRRRGGHDLASM